MKAGGTFTNGNAYSTAGLVVGRNEVIANGGAVVNFATIEQLHSSQYAFAPGVILNAGASLTNGSVSDPWAVIFANVGVNTTSATANVANFGSIYGQGTTGQEGVSLDGGVLTNGSGVDARARVQGQSGVTVAAAGTVANFGAIEGTGLASGDYGVLFTAGGHLINGSAGDHVAVIAGYVGVAIKGVAGSVTNFGTIESTAVAGFFAVDMTSGGLVTNGSLLDHAALISGYNGAEFFAAGSVINFGTIDAIGAGVGFLAGGALTNGAATDQSALIEGYAGVFARNIATTVTNFGTVTSSAGKYAADYSALGGRVTNGSGGDKAAVLIGFSGVQFNAAGTVVNYATFTGQGAAGVLASGGLVTNGVGTDTTALIQGVGGVSESALATVSNLGTIDGATGVGVAQYAGGTVLNGAGPNRSALIEGAFGVVVQGGPGTVMNSGTIRGVGGSGNFGVYVATGGKVINGSATNSTALIEGYDGVVLVGAGAVLNFATIWGQGDALEVGVQIGAGGALTNGSLGHTTAVVNGYEGVYVAPGAAGTVTNFGTIIGQGGIAVQFTSPSDVLAVEAGATFIGAVNGGGGTLDLAGGTGTITSLLVGGNVTETGSTSTFTGFGALEVGAGASFVAAGSPTVASTQGLIVAGTLTEAGTLTSAGKLTVSGTLAGTGTLALTGGAATFSTGTSLTIAKVTESGATTTASFTANLNVTDLWTQTAGTVTVATGDRINFLAAGNSFAGTLSGAGVIAFTGGADTLTGTTLSASNVLVSGGAVTLSGAINLSKTLTVASPNLTIAAAGATLSGGGALYLNTAATSAVIGASAAATLTNKEVIEGTGQLGDGQLTIVNAAGGIIAGFLTTGLTINTGAGSLSNAGLIENTNIGGTTISGAVSNTGTLLVSKGVLTVDGAVSGAGIVKISGGTADFGSTFTENVSFTGTTGVLELSHSQTYTGAITGLSTSAGGSTLDLLDIGFTSGTTKATYSGTATSGTLTVTDGTHTAKITLIGNYVGHSFTTASDGHGGTTVADPASSGTGHVIPLTPLVAAMAGFEGPGAYSMSAAAPWTSPVLTLATGHVSTA